MNQKTCEIVSFGKRIGDLASQHPRKRAIVFYPLEGDARNLDWESLERQTNRVARLFAALGVNHTSMVAVGLKNSLEHVIASIAAWKLGACVLPLSVKLPDRERRRVLDLAQPAVLVSDWNEPSLKVVTSAQIAGADEWPEAPLPERMAQPGKAIASGGSTGSPKIIVDPTPWVWNSEAFGSLGQKLGFRQRQVQLVPGPLYHNSPFCWTHWGLIADHEIILLERFNAPLVVDILERHRVNFACLVPTMMSRILEVPGVRQRDFSSLHSIFHTAAPCPPWLKRAWIDLIGGERLFEAFGSTEGVGYTVIRGDEWLVHTGSVGKPDETEVIILDEEGQELPAGQVGEIYMRLRKVTDPTYYYLGSERARTRNGFSSVGDMGWLDEEGYLFLADRRTDLIITGGANVYPAEVEAALTEHPGVQDCVVLGVQDREWGKRVHAVIEPVRLDDAPSEQDLDRHCRDRLASYKVPRSYEFVADLPRNEAGKIRRSALAAERSAPISAGDDPSPPGAEN